MSILKDPKFQELLGKAIAEEARETEQEQIDIERKEEQIMRESK
jgi:hypothetical protein